MQRSYAGLLRGRMSRGGLELAETSYRSGQRVHRHVHDRPMLMILLGGRMTEHACERSVRYCPGTVAFHPAGEPHAHTFGGSTSRCLSLQIDESWRARLSINHRRALPDGPTARLDEAVTGAARLLHAEFRHGEEASSAALDGLVLAILGFLTRVRPLEDQNPDFLNIVVERLQDDLQTNVQLDVLAELAGVSPEHLSRTFRAKKGVTIGEYVRRLRVERARTKLIENKHSLGRIALEVGFYDQSHFTRTFKAHVGCTPGEYRRWTRDLKV